MPEPYCSQVFISHSSKDREWAAAFADALRAGGVESWLDVSQLRPGERWQERLQEALRNSRVLVVVLSANNLGNPWLFFELGVAIADNKLIIPVVIDDSTSEDIPLMLRKYQLLRELSPDGAGQQIAETIEHSVIQA